jgi:cell shape-determining protein MreC
MIAFIVLPVPFFHSVQFSIWDLSSCITQKITQSFLTPFRKGAKNIQDAVQIIQNYYSYSTVDYRKQIDNLETIIQQQQQQIRELKKQNQITSLSNFAGIPRLYSSILGCSLQADSQILFLPRDDRQQFSYKNATVLTAQGLVGRIIHSRSFLHWVMLISDYRSQIPVQNLEGSFHGLLCGQASQPLVLKCTQTTGKNFQKGDVLVTSGIGGIYPKNLPVARIISDQNAPIYANPIVTIQNLDQVQVMRYAEEVDLSTRDLQSVSPVTEKNE